MKDKNKNSFKSCNRKGMKEIFNEKWNKFKSYLEDKNFISSKK